MKRSIRLVGGIMAFALLGCAAYVGGQLLAPPDLNSESQDPILSGSGDTRTGSGVMIDVTPAAEMPESPADVSGLFLRREDNSLFVGTGRRSAVLVDGKWVHHHDGPVMEVVTTHRTEIYRDNLLQELGGVAPSGPVQQVLETGSVEEMGENTSVMAWGQKRGDRLVADIVVFQPSP